MLQMCSIPLIHLNTTHDMSECWLAEQHALPLFQALHMALVISVATGLLASASMKTFISWPRAAHSQQGGHGALHSTEPQHEPDHVQTNCCVQVTVNREAMVPFIAQSLKNMELAIRVATRGDLPGAEPLFQQKFDQVRYLFCAWLELAGCDARRCAGGNAWCRARAMRDVLLAWWAASACVASSLKATRRSVLQLPSAPSRVCALCQIGRGLYVFQQ